MVAGIARILDALPADDPSRRKFTALQRRMLVKIAELQGEDGLWRSSLLEPEQFPVTPYLPASDKRVVWRAGSYKLDNGYCPGTRVIAHEPEPAGA